MIIITSLNRGVLLWLCYHIHMDNLSKANLYVEEHKKDVKQTFRQVYHAMPPLNWCNDPNGFSFYKGEYHLFFQFYPYECKWGPMHWGHVVSKDLLHFSYLPIALAPAEEGESGGCFSGTAIPNPKDPSELLVYFTSHNDENGVVTQQTSFATSSDGINFQKHGYVVSSKDIAQPYSTRDFRDPKVFYENGTFYLLMATNNGGKGCLAVYAGKSKEGFSFHMEISLPNMGIQAECPDLLKIGDKYVLIYSAIHKDGPSTNVYAVLNLDLERKTYECLHTETLDYGGDFYAAQSCYDGRSHYLTAWLESWKQRYEFQETKQGWVGSFCLPRELSLEDNVLVQKPVKAFFENLGEEGEINETGALFFSLKEGEKLILEDEDPSHRVSIESLGNELKVELLSDLENTVKTIPYDGKGVIAALDKSSFELFLENGKAATFFHHFGQGKITSSGANVSFRPYLG